ncbi:DNA cytosine methyltransferase [Candidatus Nomurabacteria bacterium]|nr:DNA cytosine methyltransferase [Candidatus Nomurabacteria bacterium]
MSKKPKKDLKVIDLFSGCGGMSWGLHKNGFKVVAGIDNWTVALKTFKQNHKDALIYDTDIRDLDAKKVAKDLGLKKGELDCIVGGPPCQGFSKNVPSTKRFLDDPRNQLFKDYLRFVKELLPKVVIMENVAELYNAFGGSVREDIVKQLKEMGYEVEVKVLYAPDYGVPQRRRRCIFFASRTGIKPVFPKPQYGDKKAYISAWDAISDLPSIKNGKGSEEMEYDKKPLNEYQEEMRKGSKLLHDHKSRELREKQYARLAYLKPGQAIKDLPDELRPKSGFSGAYGRLDFKMIAPTITRWVFHPGSGRFGHPKDIRTITIREAARLHSFSDDFEFVGTNTDRAGQIGNAVPPRLMEALSKNIKNCLDL